MSDKNSKKINFISLTLFFLKKPKWIILIKMVQLAQGVPRKTTQNEYKVDNLLPYISTTDKKKPR